MLISCIDTKTGEKIIIGPSEKSYVAMTTLVNQMKGEKQVKKTQVQYSDTMLQAVLAATQEFITEIDF